MAGGERDTPNLTATDKVISPPLTTTTSTGRTCPPTSEKTANPSGEFDWWTSICANWLCLGLSLMFTDWVNTKWGRQSVRRSPANWLWENTGQERSENKWPMNGPKSPEWQVLSSWQNSWDSICLGEVIRDDVNPTSQAVWNKTQKGHTLSFKKV